MVDISNNAPIPLRELSYYRRRNKNRLFSEIAKFFAEEAQRTGITKKDIAERLNKDPASVTRWLSQPSNLTSDTVSDLLLALNAEMDYRAALFAHRPKPNAMHPLIASLTPGPQVPPVPPTSVLPQGVSPANISVSMTTSGGVTTTPASATNIISFEMVPA